MPAAMLRMLPGVELLLVAAAVVPKGPFLQGLRARLGVFWNSLAAAALRTPGRNSCAALVVTDFFVLFGCSSFVR